MGRTTPQHLPNEILAEIFIHCLPTDPLVEPQPHTGVAPLLLCRVCSLWRMIAIHTPYLWTTIGLDLEYAFIRTLGTSGFPQQKLDALRMWSDRTGILSPSISLRRFHTRVVYDKADQLVSHATFFSTPTLRASGSLDLNGFSESDLRTFSEQITDFPKLKHLVVKQPGGREHNLRRLQFPHTPSLQRLYFDCFIDNGPAELTIQAMFSWKTLTHLCANLELHPAQWRVLPSECCNLEHLTLNVHILVDRTPQTNSQPTLNPVVGENKRDLPFIVVSTLRSMTIHAPPADFDVLFHKIHFPNLISLRLSSSTTAMIKLDTLHRSLSTTPSLRELHLRTCLGFGNPGFLSYPGGNDSANSNGLQRRQRSAGRSGAITLSTYVPALEVLVIDGMGLEALPAMPRDIFRLLDSYWLGDGWEDEHSLLAATGTSPRRRIEIILNFDFYFSKYIIDQVQERLAAEATAASGHLLPFVVHIAHAPRGLWQWKQLQVRDLRDSMWNDFVKFYAFGFNGMAALA